MCISVIPLDMTVISLNVSYGEVVSKEARLLWEEFWSCKLTTPIWLASSNAHLLMGCIPSYLTLSS